MMPRFRPIVTAWARSFAPNLDRMFVTWLFRVASPCVDAMFRTFGPWTLTRAFWKRMRVLRRAARISTCRLPISFTQEATNRQCRQYSSCIAEQNF